MTRPRRVRPGASKKVTISLPSDLFADVEAARKEARLDRSSWLQEAVAERLRRDRRADAAQAYIQSYRSDPESTAEIEESTALAIAMLRSEPWE